MGRILRAVPVILSLFVVLLLKPTLLKPTQAIGTELPEARTEKVVKQLGNLPAFFMENQGQVAEEVRYYFKGSDTVYFTNEAVVFQKIGNRGQGLGDREDSEIRNVPGEPSARAQAEELARYSLSYKLEFVGANHTSPQARSELEGKVNYLIGNDPSSWHTNIPTYQEIVYPQVYDGIDLVYKGVSGGMKYEFVVHPGASPENIGLAYTGTEGLGIDEKGNLIIRTALGDVKDEKPYTYQEIGGRKAEVSSSFRLINPPAPSSLTHSYGFQVASYDENYPLVIDPGLAYSTFLGGSNNDEGRGIAVDALGNSYVTGVTYSSDFPATLGILDTSLGGSRDAFVTKLNPTGSSLLYSTFLGGSNSDDGNGIAVDASGNAYVTGLTYSSDFPTTPGAFDTSFNGVSDAFVTKLDSTGSSLIYSTFLGGSDAEHHARTYFFGEFGDNVVRSAIALDASGNVYVSGITYSSDFPTTPGAFDTSFNGWADAFVTKLDSTGSNLLFSTFLGGSSLDEGALGIAVDAAGDAYVTGVTYSSDFPTTPGAFDTSFNGGLNDPFVAKLNSIGGLVYSTFLGGTSWDGGMSIAVDDSGNAYVAGVTYSSNFPTTPGAFDTSYNGGDGFVTKLDSTGSILIYSTFLGGSAGEHGNGIAVDTSGNAYVTGYTASGDFPTTIGAYDTGYNGSGDVFVTEIDPTGSSLIYSTLFGGGMTENLLFLPPYNPYPNGRIALDTVGNIYITGNTFSSNFPTTAGAFDTSYNGGGDAFVAKFSLGENRAPIANAGPDQTVHVGASVTLDGSGSSDPDGNTPLSFTWDITLKPQGSTAALSDPTVSMPSFTPDVMGDYTIRLVVTDSLGAASAPDTVKISTINSGITPPPATIADSVREFSSTQGQNNWYYGYYDGPFTSSDFQLMTQFILNFHPVVDYWFVQEGTYWTSLWATGGHPNGLNGNQGRLPLLQWAVRRWVSEVAGTITISGTFASIGGGDTAVYIIVDGVQLWSQYIPGAGNRGSYTVTTTVQVGSTVDFAIDPGPAGVDVNDSTEFDATINTIDLVANQPPVADAGPDETVHVGASVTLDGSGSSDPDGNTPLSFAWDIILTPQGSTAALSDATVSMPSFTPDVMGDYTIQLVVTDSLGAASAPDTVKISTTNSAPVADAGPDQLILGGTVQLNGSRSYDLDGDGMTYSWSLTQTPQYSTAAISDPSIPNPTFVADYYGNYVATLVVTDSFGATGSPDTVTVSFTNLQPVADAGTNQAVRVGQLVFLDGSGSNDANGDFLTYNWTLVSKPMGSLTELFDATAVRPSFIADAPGTYIVSLVVNDGVVDSAPSNITVTATSTLNEVVETAGTAIITINAIAPSMFTNPNMRNALTNKINAVLDGVNQGLYQEAIDKLQNDVLAKTDGCTQTGVPDKNDWIKDCTSQNEVYLLILQAIELLRGML